MARHYEWKRYWSNRDAARGSGDGYFHSPGDIFSSAPVTGAWQLAELTQEPCLVLLGEPGLGKTHTLRQAAQVLDAEVDGEHEVVEMIDLGAYENASLLAARLVDGERWGQWVNEGKVLHLFLDSFDEALVHQRAVSRLLIRELEAVSAAIPRLRLRIACRSAEWLRELGQDLHDLFRPAYPEWAGELPREMVLAQLRAADVALAAEVEGIELQGFLKGISARGLEALAAIPLTLGMLIEATKESGGLPDTRTELFERASLRLVREHDSVRRRDPAAGRLHPWERLAVAERVAAAALFSAHSTISTESGEGSSGDLDPASIKGYSEEDAKSAGGGAFTVGVDEIVEVLRTAIFVDASPRTVQFRHRSIAEFLAASYVVRHQLDETQLISLFVAHDEGEGGLIPHLREIAAWTAALDPRVLLEFLKREPDVFLRVGQLQLSAEQAASLVDALLAEDIVGVFEGWDQRLWSSLRSLEHPGLAARLREPIRNRETPTKVRRFALMIASACELRELEPDLLELALDGNESADTRSHAISALGKFASPDARRALIPLALEPIPDDDDDEVKATALLATFPEYIDVETALASLTPLRNGMFMGGYLWFLSETLPKEITEADLPAALRWAATVEPRFSWDEYRDTHELNLVVDEVLTKSWPHMADPVIAEGVATVVRQRLLVRSDPLGRRREESDEVTFHEAEGRHILLEHLIGDVADDPRAKGKIAPGNLLGSKPALLRDSDLSWLLDRLDQAIGTESEASWAALITSVYTLREPEFDQIFTRLGRSTELQDRFRHRLGPIELDSDLARSLRGECSGSDQVGGAPDDDAPYIDGVIAEALMRFEQGDLDAWTQINDALVLGPRGQVPDSEAFEADITRLPGWERADGSTRARLLTAARPYLEGVDPAAEEWFGQKLPGSARAGYRALYLLAKIESLYLRQLGEDVWARWVPVVLSVPGGSDRDDRDGVRDRLRWEAVERARDAVSSWTARKVDFEAGEGDGYLFLLQRLHGFRDARLTEALLPKLADEAMRPNSVADLLKWTLNREPEQSVELVRPRLAPESVARGPGGREMAKQVATILLRMHPAVGWPATKSLAELDPELGAEVMLDFSQGEEIKNADLSDAQLAELMVAMFEAVPPHEDHLYGPGARLDRARERARQMRDRTVSILAERGSEEAVDAVGELSERYPIQTWLRDARQEAKDALRARGRAPEPRDIVRLCVTNDARLVFSDGDLQQAVMASLGRIQRTLQEGQPPAAAELWDGEPRKPKPEEEISNWLTHRLRDDLRTGGRVINREVLVKPSKSGKGRGESADIQITAPTGKFVEEADVATVLIEVKGCWNRGVKSDMADQLVGRYLSSSGNTHGIYVVLWFSAESWASSDHRRSRCGKADLQATRELFERQASGLSGADRISVRSFVLDGSI